MATRAKRLAISCAAAVSLAFAAGGCQGPCVLYLDPWPGGNLEDAHAVFAHFFRALPPEVTVYPSENHFYFAFSAPLGDVTGNLWIDVLTRDKGEVAFTYAVRSKGVKVLTGDIDLRAPAIRLKRLDSNSYDLTFSGKTVRFHLHELSPQPPSHLRLLPGESYVGPSFDDSGLEFSLVFSNARKHFLWILNEDRPPSETWEHRAGSLLLGRRTHFAFYDDQPLQRKILVAVSAAESRLNSPYDGPFDQLPDNLIAAGKVDLRRFLAQTVDDPSDLDRFGRSKSGGSVRASIAPYGLYRDLKDLDAIGDCGKRHPTKITSGFYACLAGFE